MQEKDYDKMKASKSAVYDITETDFIKNIFNSSKKSKKKNPLVTIITILIFIIGFISGYVAIGYLTQNDCCKLLGEDYVCVQMFDNYESEGVKVISFGQDLTEKQSAKYMYREDISFDAVEVENVNTSVSGIYYEIYKINSVKYGLITLIRTINVMEVEIDG